ncbi:MAG: hypothetical protein ACE5D1_06355, partial [Fidelibacterota bacterium]
KDSLSVAYWKPGTMGKDSLRIQYGIAAWDTGKIILPALDVQVLNPDSSVAFNLKSDPVTIRVRSVLADSSVNALRPLKEPVPVAEAFPFRTLITILLMGVVILAMVMIWRKRVYGSVRPVKQVPPQLPPDKVAFRKLAEAEELLERDIEIFYVQLSYLLREYIEHSFYYKTLEMTAGEIRRAAADLPIPAEEMTPILDLLERADFIKFARRGPKFEEGKADLKIAGDFIRHTVPLWKIEIPPS